jgi:Zn-dependent protease
VAEATLAAATVCAGCGAELGPGLLSCPACHRLVFSVELQRLAADADAATRAGDPARALGLWQNAMELLPDGAGQRVAVSERIAALGPLAAASAPPQGAEQPQGGGAKKKGLIGAAAAFLLKAKTILFFLLAKAKLLVFGLSKLSTLASMGVYFAYAWVRFGWAFGGGLVASIYIHEMGHVSALRFFGLPAGAPVFIPGLGAFIRLKQSPPTTRVDARIGLAGPVWGLAAALMAYGLYLATGAPVWAAVAKVGAWINLFNLTPVWQLDGGRAFHSFSKRQRGMASGVILLALVVTHAHMLFLPLAFSAYQFFQPAPAEHDEGAFWTYALLVAALSAIEMLPGSTL